MTGEDINSFSYRISQASGTELTVIMFDMARAYLSDAKDMYGREDMDEFRRYVRQTRRVVDALKVSLDMKYPIAKDLYGIYSYISKTLAHAAAAGDITQFTSLDNMLKKLGQSFEQIAGQDTRGPVMGNAQKVYAGLTYTNGRLNEIAYDAWNTGSRGYTV